MVPPAPIFPIFLVMSEKQNSTATSLYWLFRTVFFASASVAGLGAWLVVFNEDLMRTETGWALLISGSIVCVTELMLELYFKRVDQRLIGIEKAIGDIKTSVDNGNMVTHGMLAHIISILDRTNSILDRTNSILDRTNSVLDERLPKPADKPAGGTA